MQDILTKGRTMTKETEYFLNLLTPENSSIIANHVADIMGPKGTEPNPIKDLDAKFDLVQGKMLKTDDVNTWFKFDAQLPLIRDIIDNGLSNPKVEANDELIKKYDAFLKQTGLIFRTPALQKKIGDALRKNLLGDAPEFVFPLTNIQVNYFEIGDLPPIDYTLKIKKEGPSHLPAVSVNQDLFEEFLRSGKRANEVIAERKAAGDERYKYVVEATEKKYLYEVNLELYVDYSPSEKAKNA